MARFIMAGRLQAFAFVSIATLLSMILPFIGLFANAAIALVTLRSGWNPGIALSIAASVVLAIITAVAHGNPVNGMLIGISQTIPIVIVATVLTRTVSWHLALAALLVMAVIMLALFHMLVPDVNQFWDSVLKAFRPIISPDWTDEQWNEWIAQVAPFITALIACGYILAFVVSLFMGRYWQAQLYNPGGFAEEFRELRLGKQLSLLAIAGVLLVMVTQNVFVLSIVMMVMALFLFQGLSLMHGLVKQSNMHVGWLVGMYVFLFFLPLQIGVMLAVFGVVDNFADIRTHLANRKKSDK